MELHEALYTTRAMRRVRPDPIPLDVQSRILDAAVRAPSGGNQQNWRFLLLDDPDKKRALAPLYQHAMGQLWETVYKTQLDAAAANPDSEESKEMLRVQRSAQWLADHFEEIPLFLFPFCQYDPSGGSIFPAVWSAMLAARAEGVGSCITALLQFFHPAETLEILGAPTDQGWILAATVSFGYPLGKWDVAQRRPVDHVSYRNTWGADVGFHVPEPLWAGTP
ncbi:MAG TPA: nitroreductase family protein [Acidimicrobiales bacterium]